MHLGYNQNHILVIALIALYLILPAMNPAHAVEHAKRAEILQADYTCAGQSTTFPCQDCPASGQQQHNDCCETTCSCTCHTLSDQGMRFAYSPMIFDLRFSDPVWFLPQIYRRIFVPPQNAA
ncbi:MAG: hypothetical protein A2X80_12105 [Geobacteraceae bacterium GWB2_52_12]|nr:MAG: hypothetical protein A2X80_12105 [Geobacteraceae bacterium GWB2_52_12]